MLKKLFLVLLLLVALAAGVFVTSEYLGINIPIVSDFIDTTMETVGITPPGLAPNFVPTQDGYKFRNYSGRYPEGNMTIEDAHEMFGDAVCTRIEGDTCIPYPQVINWVDSMNETMNEVGHCVGFTVSSDQLYRNIRSVSELGAETTFALEQEVPVLRTISQAYASYYATNVWTQEVRGKTPSEIVDALLELDAPADMGIFYPEYGRNGHSVLAHSVIDKGNGFYHIMVYDSNRPGEDNAIIVDTNADTWFYADGAVNPDEASADYKGDAQTKSLSFVPISAYNQELACPAEFSEFCPVTTGNSFSILNIFGRGQALAETERGQIGQAGDRLVNTVPDGEFLPIRGELYSRQPPIMLIPSEETFTLQAQSNEENEPLQISVTNPTYSVVIDGLIGQPSQIEQLTFDPVAQQASFVAGGPQQPLIQFIFNQDGAVYSAQLSGLVFEAGQDLTVTVDAAAGDLQLASNTLNVEDVVVMVVRLTIDTETVFASEDAVVTAGGSQALDLNGWDGTNEMTILMDGDGDGTYESETSLPNQPVAEVLSKIRTADDTIESLQNVIPYLDDGQTRAVVETLPTLGFSGEALGNAYLELPDLRPNDLASTLADLGLSPEELGALIVSLRLDGDETRELLNNLRLTRDERTVVEEVIANRQMLLDTLSEWEFLNTGDPDGLGSFLEDKNLPDDQIDEFINIVSDVDEVASISVANTPVPAATETPPPATSAPTTAPTATSTPLPTITNTPVPAPTNTLVPTNTPSPTTPPDPCADLTPPEPGWPVSVRFFNSAGYDVAYSWINDSSNALEPQGTISFNDFGKQNTTPGHVFQFELQGGSVTYTVGSELMQCAVITSNDVVKQ